MKLRSEMAIFKDVSDQRLAEWWCELNRWGWPKDLKSPEERKSIEEGGNPRRTAIMHEIVDKIGIRACMREWNRETMSDAEFDAWWRSNRRAA